MYGLFYKALGYKPEAFVYLTINIWQSLSQYYDLTCCPKALNEIQRKNYILLPTYTDEMLVLCML